MAELQNLLAALAAQQSQSQGGTPAPGAPPPIHSGQYPPPNYGTPPAGVSGPYGLPQPISSGSVDLGGIQPISSGTVNLAGDKSYDHRTSSRNDGRRDQRRSRSPSPPRGRDGFRDAYNPYRDERRGAGDRSYARDRSLSPQRDRFGSPAYRDRSPPRAGGSGSGAGADGESEVVAIEKGLVGLIIGRGGENLRRVERETGARVQFMDSADTPGTKRHCRVSGSRSAVASAKAEIYKIIEDNELAKRGQDAPRVLQAQAGLTVTQEGDSLQMMVPDRTVGLIIGRGGETIRELQDRSGCHINIVGENKSVNGFRPVNLIGSAASQRIAKDLVIEIVESDQKGISVKELHGRREDPHSKVNDNIMVPGDAVGMIIGKGGETIREMQDRTGCKINVSPASGRDIEREIGLIGTRGAIEAAKRVILEKVDAARARNRSHSDQPYDRHGSNPPAGLPPMGGSQGPTPGAQAAPGAADPYAPYGGYENYVRMWYAMVQNQQQQGGQGEQR